MICDHELVVTAALCVEFASLVVASIATIVEAGFSERVGYGGL